ncbi:programmed cell death 1 ligand 1-like isoform X2 [Dendropsophus ebraccatus]
MAVHGIFLLAVLLWQCCTIINGLFTVEARTSHIIAEYGGNISMECRFKLDLATDFEKLNVLWKHIKRDGKDGIEVAKFANGKDLEILHSSHMKLLSSELRNGRAILHINNVKMTDAGQYYCIISYIGADYKVINLDVQAPYKKITSHVRNVVSSSGETVKEVSCQSFGYPEAKVIWMEEKENLTMVHNISHTLTTDMLFNVTSVVRVPAESNRILTCTFWNKISHNATSHTLDVSERIQNAKPQEWKFLLVILAIIIIIASLSAAVYAQKKGFCSIRKSLCNSICTKETVRINTDMPFMCEHSSIHI